jgi:hypothetical protein
MYYTFTIVCKKKLQEDGGNSSEEDGQLAKRLFRRSFRGSVGSAPGVFANLVKQNSFLEYSTGFRLELIFY